MPDTNSIQGWIDKWRGERDALKDRLDGLADLLSHQDLVPEARSSMERHKAALEQHRDLLTAAAAGPKRLLEAGYPNLPQPETSASIAADLAKEKRQMLAALGLYETATPAATSFAFKAGVPVPKE